MNGPYRLVVFDWEGTLGDTLGQILHTVAEEAKRLQLGEFDEQAARQYVVLGLVMAVRKIFPHLSLHQQEQLLDAVQFALLRNPSDIFLMTGAKEMLEKIHDAGISLAIATNKGQQSLRRVLQATGLDLLFSSTRSAGQVPAKPCPQMLIEIMEECGVTAVETLMVGDAVADIEMAQAIGVDAVGVDFYHQEESNLRAAGAMQVFDDYKQLVTFLKLPGA